MTPAHACLSAIERLRFVRTFCYSIMNRLGPPPADLVVLSHKRLMQKSNAEQIVACLESLGQTAKRGCIRFWGEWFGRPYDNIHIIVRSHCTMDNVLVVEFDGQETLTVYAPEKFKIDADTFIIESAERVVWEWYCYGRPAKAENLYREEFTRSGDIITGVSNVDWYIPILKPTIEFYAVEIV